MTRITHWSLFRLRGCVGGGVFSMATLLTFFVVYLCLSAAWLQGQTDPGVPDLSTRESARIWHNTWWAKTYGVPMGFTGDVLNGVPGDVSAAYRNASLLRYNMFRRMVGSQPFVLDEAKNKTAQLAATFCAVNGKLKHGGWPTTAKFYSVEASEATAACDLALGWNDPEAVMAYIYDFGENNVGFVGHRVDMLAPWMKATVGLGNAPDTISTPSVQAFAVDATVVTPNFDPDGFVCWPAAGYVPHYLVTGQWNVDIPDVMTTLKWSFKAAQITVLKNGVPQTIMGGAISSSAGSVWTIDGTADGSSRYVDFHLSSGESFYGNPNDVKDVVYHVIIDGLRKRVIADPSQPGGPDIGGGSLYKGTGRYEYDVIGYNPDLATTMTVTTQPLSQAVYDGNSALLTVAATNSTSCQWYKDWVAIPGATQGWLQVANFSTAAVGKYHALLQGPAGAMISKYATLSPAGASTDTTGKLVNISTRSYVGPGDDVLVGGFVITGTQPKLVLIRGAGPALTGMITQSSLSDPVLTLFDENQQLITHNDDWSADPSTGDLIEAAGKQVWAFSWTRGSKDAALLVTLAPGLYTAQVSGKGIATGVGLLEVYEVGSTSTNRMVNISGRTMNAIANEPAVAGFVIKGTQKRKVLIRVAGPALTGMVRTPMADPVLTLFNSSQAVIASNDDWSADSTQAATIEAAAKSSYAFAWTRGSKDAALVIELEPGLYTAQGKGKEGATGITLVEVYEIP